MNRAEKKHLEILKTQTTYGDIYNALHNVGDDPVKGWIEDTLNELLDESTMRTIRAVFNMATEEFDEDDE